MPAEEKSKRHTSCKACASRSQKKKLRKKFKLDHLLFKLDWIEQLLAQPSRPDKADLDKIVERILPEQYAAYDPLDAMPAQAIRERFRLLIKLRPLSHFINYLGNREHRPSHSGDD